MTVWEKRGVIISGKHGFPIAYQRTHTRDAMPHVPIHNGVHIQNVMITVSLGVNGPDHQVPTMLSGIAHCLQQLLPPAIWSHARCTSWLRFAIEVLHPHRQ